MQAVEQKMGVDLRLQGLQFGLACQHFGFARRLHRNQRIMQRDRQQVEQNRHRSQHRQRRPESRAQVREAARETGCKSPGQK